jgi:hypothetical protein
VRGRGPPIFSWVSNIWPAPEARSLEPEVHGVATFAIGGVHGNYQALDDLLRQVTPEIAGGDVVVRRDVRAAIRAVLRRHA